MRRNSTLKGLRPSSSLTSGSAKYARSNKLRAIVFDLFHTLVDPEDFRPKSFRRAWRIAEVLKVDREQFASYWAQTLPIRNRNRSITVVGLIREYATKMGKTLSPAVLAQLDHEIGQYQDLSILRPRVGIEPILKTIAGQKLKLGILSNSDEREVREWPKSPLTRYFDAACFSCDIGFQKPEPEAYQAVLDRLGTLSSETAYVGDGGSQELQGARASGFGLVVFMRMFVAKNGLRTPDELEVIGKSADRVVERFEDLPLTLGIQLDKS